MLHAPPVGTVAATLALQLSRQLAVRRTIALHHSQR